MSIRATDPDGNALTYATNGASALPGAVLGQTGFYRWIVPTNQPLGVYPITITVTDNGTPPLSDVLNFTITVRATSSGGTTVAPGPTIHTVFASGGQATFTIETASGATYRVWYRDDLSTGAWMQLGPDFVAANASASVTDTLAGERRFYRVELLP
jgi:hypothetical protein